MTSLFRSLIQRPEERDAGLSFDDYLGYFGFNGLSYQLGAASQTTLSGRVAEIGSDFPGIVSGAYKANGIVFACMLARQLLFSEARFQFRQRSGGRPGDLFGTKALAPLETPWPGATTGDLLSRAIQDADLAGNWFAARRPGGRIKRMRPDWVTIVLGSNQDPDTAWADLDAEVVGYVYSPQGPNGGKDPIALLPEEMAHFAPIPDPDASFRGMSWLTPVIREIMGDRAATTHKLKFFEQGATPSMVVSLDADIKREEFERWVQLMRGKTDGSVNAYRTLFLGAGARAEVVGSDLKSIDFRSVQGAGETRIAAAARIPPVIVGLSEGLDASTYSNYGQARRAFADGTMRPMWRNMAASLAPIIDVPPGAELWYDDRDIPFLAEDVKDASEATFVDAQSIKALTESGYDPRTVIDAITSGDLRRLQHTGVFSVQLHPPGADGNQPARSAALAMQERKQLLTGLIEARSSC